MSQDQPTLTEMLPDRDQVGTAVVIGFLLLAGSVWIALLGETRLPAFQAFIPVVDTILVVSDLVTATLLVSQAAVFRSRALMALGAGYLFTGLITVTHMLTFPGAFAPTGLLGAGSSSAAWVAVFWRAGFPLAIIAYALLKSRDPARLRRPATRVAMSMGAATAVAIGLSLLAIDGASLLPPLTNGRHGWYYPNLVPMVAVLIALCLGAITMLVTRRKLRLDVWLLLALLAWLLHLLLIAKTSGRYTLDWYFAYAVGSISHVIVSLALIAEASRNYARLALSVSALKDEREGKLMTMDAVTAALAHEVGQPLTAVSINAMAGMNWLIRDEPDVEMAIKSLRATIDAGNRTSEVIKSIRAAFRKQPGAVTEFSLNALVRETASFLQRELIAEKIHLQLDLDEDLPPVRADRVQMQRVLVNLFTNAIESLAATRDRPRHIAIRSSEVDGWQVRLEFADTGLGIAPETRAHIFAPFFTTKAKGSGLGLTLCRTIVEEHGGSFWAAEDGQPGATFILLLPRSDWALGDEVEFSGRADRLASR